VMLLPVCRKWAMLFVCKVTIHRQSELRLQVGTFRFFLCCQKHTSLGTGILLRE